MSGKADKQRMYLTPNQVAEMLMVSPITVRQWSQKGELDSMQTPGGHRRYLFSHVQKFAEDRSIVLHVDNGNRPKILIVDDDAQMAEFLVEVLSTRYDDIEIETAVDGFDAGLKVKTFQPSIVLLDLMMPGIDGFDVCNKLKNDPLTKYVRIIIVSGFLSDENIHKALAAGAETCIPKPVKPEKLFEILDLDSLMVK
ncbi:MAG: response regulator [Gammaproteobacteria bacterium]|nr:response regulator [Gammaproteobacteria bacterium]MCW8911060.1 response regulator [Gammaproteobacteria bacterium]MCW9056122.1 response regulator [Gammaproteobacteria bacterium]